MPHSEIPGSKDVDSSPRLIAVYHVFLQPPTPEHPPCTLSNLATITLWRPINLQVSIVSILYFIVVQKFRSKLSLLTTLLNDLLCRSINFQRAEMKYATSGRSSARPNLKKSKS